MQTKVRESKPNIFPTKYIVYNLYLERYLSSHSSQLPNAELEGTDQGLFHASHLILFLWPNYAIEVYRFGI